MNRKQPYPTLASTFDCSIIAVLTEAHFWDKLHSDEFATPNVILGICHQREVLRLVRERVMILVRAYNELIDDLSGISELYTDYLKRLEKKIYPGFTKVMWSTRQIVIERYVQVSVQIFIFLLFF
jgi:dynein heavy chain